MIDATAPATRHKPEPARRIGGQRPTKRLSCLPLRRYAHLMTIHNCRQQGFSLEIRRLRQAGVGKGTLPGTLGPVAGGLRHVEDSRDQRTNAFGETAAALPPLLSESTIRGLCAAPSPTQHPTSPIASLKGFSCRKRFADEWKWYASHQLSHTVCYTTCVTLTKMTATGPLKCDVYGFFAVEPWRQLDLSLGRTENGDPPLSKLVGIVLPTAEMQRATRILRGLAR